MVIRKGFSVWQPAPMMKLLHIICISLERRNFRFPNVRRNQVNVDSTRTKKLKLQYKVAVKLPFRRLESVSPTVQFTLQNFFLLFFFVRFLFSVNLFCMNFLWHFPHPLPITLLMFPLLVFRVKVFR